MTATTAHGRVPLRRMWSGWQLGDWRIYLTSNRGNWMLITTDQMSLMWLTEQRLGIASFPSRETARRAFEAAAAVNPPTDLPRCKPVRLRRVSDELWRYEDWAVLASGGSYRIIAPDGVGVRSGSLDQPTLRAAASVIGWNLPRMGASS